MKRFLQLILFLIGIGLFSTVIWAVGFKRLSIIFPALAGWGWLVFFVYPFMCFWDVLGWRTLFDPRWGKQLKLWELYWIRIAGEAVNNITPFIDVAGEFLKVILLEKRLTISKKGALAAGVMCRSALLFAEIVFVLLGLAFGSFFLPIPRSVKVTLFVTLILLMLAAFLLILTQKKGLFLTLLKWLERFGIDPKLFSRFHTSLTAVDEEIAHLYRHDAKRLWRAIGLHLIGWISGGIEIWIMLRLLGVPATLFEGVILEALIQLIRTSSFFIPGNLGVQEGGLALILGMMDVPPYLGVALSLLKRCRQIIWTSIGFFVWGIFQLLEMRLVNKA